MKERDSEREKEWPKQQSPENIQNHFLGPITFRFNFIARHFTCLFYSSSNSGHYTFMTSTRHRVKCEKNKNKTKINRGQKNAAAAYWQLQATARLPVLDFRLALASRWVCAFARLWRNKNDDIMKPNPILFLLFDIRSVRQQKKSTSRSHPKSKKWMPNAVANAANRKWKIFLVVLFRVR